MFPHRIQAILIQRDELLILEVFLEFHKLLNKIYENMDIQPPFLDLRTLRKRKLHRLVVEGYPNSIIMFLKKFFCKKSK